MSPHRAATDPYRELADRDPVLARLIARHGRRDPFGWDDGGRTGDDNFAALLLHIAGQQISTAVAFTLFDRLTEAVGARPDAAGVMALGAEPLHALGLSRAKASYMLGLAEMQLAGTIDVYALKDLTDSGALAALTAVKGLGPWTAQMFLLHQLHREDILPAADIGIRRAVERAWSLPALPTPKDTAARAEDWAPFRSYAAGVLWGSLGAAAA